MIKRAEELHKNQGFPPPRVSLEKLKQAREEIQDGPER